MRFTRATIAAAVAVLLLVPFALLAVLVIGNVDWLHSLDLRVTDRLHSFAVGHPAWVWFENWWSLIFHPNTWRIAAAGLALWLVRRGDRALAWWVAVTMTAGGLMGVLLKLLVGRDRPDLLDPVARAAGYSFPSGHALTNALGAAVFLVVLIPHTRRKGARAALWAFAIVIPVITAVCRVALGVHWTSDVLAGLILGVAVPAVTAFAFLAFASRRSARQNALRMETDRIG